MGIYKRIKELRIFYSLKAVVGIIIILIVGIAAIIPGYLSVYHPHETKPLERLTSPSSEHIFGTDDLGRDIFSRVIYASRLSLQIAVASTAIAAILGIVLGSLSGFYNYLDTFLMRIVDLLMCFPQLLVAMLAIIILGRSIASLSIAIGLIYIPSMARLVRSKVLSLREEEFVKAGYAMGRSSLSILAKHVVPNTLSEIIVQATVTIGFAILIEAGLSYVGLGAPPPQPSWGRMIRDAQGFLSTAPHMALFPGLALLITVIGCNLLGDGLRDILDPKETLHQ